MAQKITLVMPGLFNVASGWREHPEQWPHVPSALTLLSRAQRLAQPELQEARLVCQLSGLTLASNDHAPMAPLSLLAEGKAPQQSYWMRADPVLFQADRDCIWVRDMAEFPLSMAESTAIAQSCAPLFAAHGCRLHTPHPARWYLQLPHAPQLVTHTIQDACGRNAHEVMPIGAHAKHWRQLLNDIQMLLHTHPVNLQRLQADKPPMNSLWFWGEGVLPEVKSVTWDQMVSDAHYCQGLAKLAQRPYAVATNLDAIDDVGAHLMVVLPDPKQNNPDLLVDPWRAYWHALESNWFAPLLRRLATRQVTEALIYPVSGHAYRVTPSVRFQFWKRTKTLAHFLSSRR